MGVPGFFSWVLRQNRGTNNNITILYSQFQKKYNKQIDHLFIDANAIIHNSSSSVLSSKSITEKEYDKLIIKQTIHNFNSIIEKFNPIKSAYIMIDGIPPCPKIIQQRYRRYMSSHLSTMKKQLHNTYNTPINMWSSLKITPGTSFMKQLDVEIKKYIKFNTKYNIVYSSHNEIGEGEHKMMNIIRKSISLNENVFIYGLDADLLFLSMIIPRNNIYLVRDNISKGSNDDTVVNIMGLKNKIYSIVQGISNSIYKIRVDIGFLQNVINDFVFMFYFFGNDFLPEQQVFTIYDDIMTFVNVYCKVKYNINSSLVKDREINISFLLEFLFQLSLIEKDLYKNEYFTRYIKHKDSIAKRSSKLKDIQKDLYDIDYPLYEKEKKFINDFKDFKFDYYKFYTGQEYKQQDIIDAVCKNYLMGLMWTYQYYFYNDETVYQWSYQYPFAPFITDLYNYIKNNNYNINNYYDEIKKYNPNPLTREQQLICVIPITELKILDKDLYTKLNKTTLIYMFPETYEFYGYDKLQFYKFKPHIPFIDFNIVNEFK